MNKLLSLYYHYLSLFLPFLFLYLSFCYILLTLWAHAGPYMKSLDIMQCTEQIKLEICVQTVLKYHGTQKSQIWLVQKHQNFASENSNLKLHLAVMASTSNHNGTNKSKQSNGNNNNKNALWGRCFTSTSFAPHLSY